MEAIVVSGAALNVNEAKITVRDVPDKPGAAAELFKRIAEDSLNIDMIVQNISVEGTTDLSFTVISTDTQEAFKVANEFAKAYNAGAVELDENIAKLSIVGIGMRSHSGVAALMFETLAKNNINIQMISTSEIKTSVVIEESLGIKALRSIHEAFELHKAPADRDVQNQNN